MFTGIIKRVGRVKENKARGKAIRLVIDAGKWDEKLEPGDSVAVNGACLTIVKREGSTLSFDMVPDTLQSTALGLLKNGEPVNLEPSLRAGDALGGHFVTGHVDAVGKVQRLDRQGDSWLLEVEAPPAIMRYVIHKGSVAVEGISLTVQRASVKSFEIAIIPHTMENTNLGSKRKGARVNLEADCMAKYMEKYFLDYLRETGEKDQLLEKRMREEGF